eukprot:jgi/Bigna1/86008/estExt_fgenesh1_pg.C_70242
MQAVITPSEKNVRKISTHSQKYEGKDLNQLLCLFRSVRYNQYANQKDFPPDQRSVKEMRCGEAKGGFQFRETIRLAKRKIIREEPERFELSLKTNSQQGLSWTPPQQQQVLPPAAEANASRAGEA